MHSSISIASPGVATASEGSHRVFVGCTPIDPCTFEEAVDTVIEFARDKRAQRFVVTPNAQHSLLLEVDPEYRSVYERAALSVPDGTSMAIGAWLLGHRLRERVPGVDLFVRVCERAAAQGLKVFLFGGKPQSASITSEVLKRKFPKLAIASYCPPYGFEKSQCEMDKADAVIRGFSPDIIFVGLGAPKQEFWMARHAKRLQVPVAIGVGGSFELVGGIIPRAPKLLRRLGLEWLFRLLHEPKRLWRRYILGGIAFYGILFKHLTARIAIR